MNYLHSLGPICHICNEHLSQGVLDKDNNFPELAVKNEQDPFSLEDIGPNDYDQQLFDHHRTKHVLCASCGEKLNNSPATTGNVYDIQEIKPDLETYRKALCPKQQKQFDRYIERTGNATGWKHDLCKELGI